MTDTRKARSAYRLVGVIVPLALLVLATAIVIAWLPRLPDVVAVHWGPDGRADGFGPQWMTLVPLLIGIALIGLLALLAHRSPSGMRMLGAVGLGVSTLLAIVTVGTLGMQSSEGDADPSAMGLLIAIALVASFGLGALAWVAQPKPVPPAPPTRAGEPLRLAAGERAAWFGSVAIARTGIIIIGAAITLVLVFTAVAIALAPVGGGWGTAWILIGTLILLVVCAACGLAFRVRVTAAGLQVASLLGWPSTRIPLQDIDEVTVADIDPMAEFGGFGWRLAMDGRRGVVLRRGEALQVRRRNGKVFVVTVDGADEAATVLESLRTRAGASEKGESA